MSIYRSLHNILSNNWKTRTGVGLCLLLSLGGLALGCGSSDDDGTAGSTAAGGSMATAGAGADTPPFNFSGIIVDSVKEEAITVVSFTVRALNNDTGEALPGYETVSDSSSRVTFSNLPSSMSGFMVVGIKAQAIDTYSFNVKSKAQNRMVRVVAKSSVQTVKLVANVTLNPDNADVAGQILWVDSTGAEKPVGCATVTIDDGVGEVRYFASNELPTTNVPLASAPNLEVRTNSNPLNGKFYIANAVPGRHKITAIAKNGQTLGSASLTAFAGKSSTDGENAISLTDIYAEGQTADPTPADCK